LNNKVKIGSIILFTTIIGIIVVLSFVIKKNDNTTIKFIELKGNYHLSQNEYMNYAHLDNHDEYSVLSSKLIKDRLDKHPYIKSVDVILSEGILNIEIFEKNFVSLLMANGKEYLISDEAVVIPKLQNSEMIDFPIISEPSKASEITEFSKAILNSDVKIGLKIIAAIKIINPKLYKSLSEVNLRDGKDIILQFSSLNIPIVVGRNNEIEKIVLFEKLMQKLDYSKIESTLSYIDLRYSKYLYVGKSNEKNSEQDSNS